MLHRYKDHFRKEVKIAAPEKVNIVPGGFQRALRRRPAKKDKKVE